MHMQLQDRQDIILYLDRKKQSEIWRLPKMFVCLFVSFNAHCQPS